MNQIKELKQIKDFSTGNKVRELIAKEMQPTIQKYYFYQKGWKIMEIRSDRKWISLEISIKLFLSFRIKRIILIKILKIPVKKYLP